MGVSVWDQCLVFPIGRHSLMHTWVPRTAAPTLAAHGGRTNTLAGAVFAVIQSVSKGSEYLSQWNAVVVAQNLTGLGLSGGLPLSEYMTAVVRAGLGCFNTRLQAFEGLCEFLKNSPATMPGRPQ